MKSSTLPDVSGLTDSVTESVSDAVSSGIDVVHDVAGVIAGLAPVVAGTVARNAAGLVDNLGSGSSDRRVRPWMIVVAVIGGFALAAWVLRRRRSADGGSQSVSDLREHSERAKAAAAG